MYINRADGYLCGETTIQLFKGADSTREQERRQHLMMFQREEGIYEHFKKVRDLQVPSRLTRFYLAYSTGRGFKFLCGMVWVRVLYWLQSRAKVHVGSVRWRNLKFGGRMPRIQRSRPPRRPRPTGSYWRSPSSVALTWSRVPSPSWSS